MVVTQMDMVVVSKVMEVHDTPRMETMQHKAICKQKTW